MRTARGWRCLRRAVGSQDIALHGLEEAAGVRYQGYDEARVEKDSPVLIRYADDFAV